MWEVNSGVYFVMLQAGNDPRMPGSLYRQTFEQPVKTRNRRTREFLSCKIPVRVGKRRGKVPVRFGKLRRELGKLMLGFQTEAASL